MTSDNWKREVRPLFPEPPSAYGVVTEVLDELRRAREMFGPFHSAHEGHAVLREEFEELWEAVKRHNPKMTSAEDYIQMREEAIQVAAMALRFILDVCPQTMPPRGMMTLCPLRSQSGYSG